MTATHPLAAQAGFSTVTAMFRTRAALTPQAPALQPGEGAPIPYQVLDARVTRAAAMLASLGVGRGDRVAILSENRSEYLELLLACGALGAILACQNWRLAPPELRHCIALVAPVVVVVSGRHAALLDHSEAAAGLPRVTLGDDYEARLAAADPVPRPVRAQAEDGLMILYTSGTTGLPKGAVISHRAEIARALVGFADLGTKPGDTNLCWPPLFHMAAAEPALSTLMTGGKVVVVDGFAPDEIARHIGRERLGHLMLMPGMIEPLCDAMERQAIVPRGMAACGAMADLVPAHQLARVTRLLNAPYLNTFGSTETGAPPASANLLAIGAVPTSLSKKQSSFCEIRLVDPDDHDVAPGAPGELAIRGPTVFSGYWNADATNAKDFRGGWFHMGDMFVRRPDGTLDFVDRVKYMIKSGGENVYPAEIERALMLEARVADAIVVRRPDPKWGEVPVAVVARKDDSLTAAELLARCRTELAGFKQPKDVVFVALEELPRSTTGKIQRHEVEAWLTRRAAAAATSTAPGATAVGTSGPGAAGRRA